MSGRKLPIANESAQKRAPGPRTQEAIEAAISSNVQRPVRVSTDFAKTGSAIASAASPHSDEAGNAIFLRETFGTASSSFAAVCLGQLEWATRARQGDPGESLAEVNAGLALVGAIGPSDELEAALAVQIAGCHSLAMEMLARAKVTDRADHLEMYGNMAVKLQRTFTAQLEALGRLRGKGQQTVRVEHVTVQPGGQAIVGDVHHHPRGAPGGQARTEEQPHEKTATATSEGGKALPGPDPTGNGVPVPSDAERPMPAPRRTVARRPRQPKRVEAR